MERHFECCDRSAQFSYFAAASPGGHPSCRNLLFFAIVGFVAVAVIGCGYAGSPSSQSSPPSTVTVSVQPGSGIIFLGATQQFQATVAGTSNSSVTWTVDGAPGGNSTVGTISAAGLYSAPAILPSPPSVTITAVSSAVATATGSAAVTLKDDIAVTVSPPTATVPADGGQVFAASISGTPGFATGATWSVNGIVGGNTSVGTIAVGGPGTEL